MLQTFSIYTVLHIEGLRVGPSVYSNPNGYCMYVYFSHVYVFACLSKINAQESLQLPTLYMSGALCVHTAWSSRA